MNRIVSKLLWGLPLLAAPFACSKSSPPTQVTNVNNADASLSCVSDKDCRAQGKFCDTRRFVCVGCLTQVDCGQNEECTNGSCTAFTPCTSSKECAANQVCDRDRQRCAECVTNADCSAEQTCLNYRCARKCSSDKECRELNQVCNTTQNSCVECIAPSDCGAGKTCVANSCVASLCAAESASCDGRYKVICDGSGLGFSSRVECGGGCELTTLAARCVGGEGPPNGAAGTGAGGETNNAGATGTGAISNGGATGGSAGANGGDAGANQGGNSNDPCNKRLPFDAFCTSIPKLVGTHTLGSYSASPFCGYTESLASELPNVVTDSLGDLSTVMPPGSNTRIRVRNAWSETDMHYFVSITDPYLQPYTTALPDEVWSGDGFEFFLAANPERVLQGVTGDVAMGALQVIFAAPTSTRPVEAHSMVGGKASAYSATNWAGRRTETGWELEVKVPWTQPMAAGAPILYYWGLNVAEPSTPRQAGAPPSVYKRVLKAFPNVFPSGGTCDEPYCDPSKWCRSTLAP